MATMNQLIKVTLFGLIAISPAYSAHASDLKSAIKEAVARSGQAINIPHSRSIAIFNDPESIVITANLRYVVKGRIFDMWQKVEIKDKASLEHSTTVIPLQKINVNTTNLLDAKVNQEKSEQLTVFLDPFLPSSAQVVHVLTKYVTEFELRFIFTAMSQENVSHLFNFACDVEEKTSNEILDMIASNNVNFINTPNKCLEKKVMNSFGLTHFLRLTTSPTLIAPNGKTSEKLPPNLMAWLAENKE